MPFPLKTKLISQLSRLKQAPSDNGLDSEAIKVILHEHNSSHPDKNPIKFVQRDNLESVINQTLQAHEESKNNRYQFVVKTDNHYLVVDLEVSEGKAKALVLDAANDWRFYSLALDLSEVNGVEQVYFAYGKTNRDNIQKDGVSCPVFTLSHAQALQSLEIYEHIEQEKVAKNKPKEGIAGVSWTHMLPEININTQSSALWDNYKKEFQKTFNVADNYFDNYDQYRTEMHRQSSVIELSVREQSGNIIPAVFQRIAAPALGVVRGPIPESKLKELVFEDTPVSIKANNLLNSIQNIIQNTNWKEITRVGDKPKNILQIEKFLKDNRMNVYEKLENIQTVCKAAHASGFEFLVSSTLRGKNAFTNQLYGILGDAIVTDEKSVDNAINNLNELTSEQKMNVRLQ